MHEEFQGTVKRFLGLAVRDQFGGDEVATAANVAHRVNP
jgi:hypothetical protein